MIKRPSRAALAATVIMAFAASAAAQAPPALPDGFVYLRDVDPTIQQDIRYAGSNNFLGRPVAGYLAAECILTRPAAMALKAAQASLAAEKLSLKVYDCLRPVRAVQDFVAWAEDPAETAMQAEYYSGFTKPELFERGFIARRSGHALGHMIDLTIVPAGSMVPERPAGATFAACHKPKAERAPDNSLDMGTGYDCFHALSATSHRAVGGDARRNRQRLLTAMTTGGFANYAKEWWHFSRLGSAAAEPQDFPIRPR